MRLSPVQKIENISSEDFIKTYLKPAKPVILKDLRLLKVLLLKNGITNILKKLQENIK